MRLGRFFVLLLGAAHADQHPSSPEAAISATNQDVAFHGANEVSSHGKRVDRAVVAEDVTGPQSTIDAAMTALAVAEIPRMNAYLERTSKEIAAKHAKREAKKAASVATGRAFRAARTITATKASQYCASISHLASLPSMCDEEARQLMNTLKRSKLAAWESSANDAAVAPAQKAAAAAALAKAKPAAKTEIEAVARRMGRRYFQLEYPRAQNKWLEIENKEKTTLARKKAAFYKAATDAIILEVNKKVKAALWDKPITTAMTKMTAAAKAEARKTAANVAAATLAPKFVTAAKAALPIAVRAAHKKAIDQWNPKWSPSSTSVDGATPDLIG
jgi:hypothetical protein